ncbi:ParB/RepB/Spo0J family partition protein [Atopobium fossor]|uniref:ParB/RepB/Spo0J family partition protein n=1 Tax=Atopobium fossor TaxID=39487 RepID=UPI0004262F0A|nr:ParB/RepB/Spo0J family partition protein [Atopobium fossor]
MAKSGLGKGLGSLISEANHEVSAIKADSKLPLSSITPNPNQPRKVFEPDALAELASSIEQNGILQPILVRKKGVKYEIVAGERRYQAAKLAKLKDVPVIIRDVSDDEILQLALIENLQRSNLNPIEEAQGYKQLIKKNKMTQEELAKVLSKSRSAITNTLRLLDLPDNVQAYMLDGRLSAGHARAILAVPTEEGREKLAQKVVDDHLSVRQTESLAPLFSGERSETKPRQVAPQSFKRAARQLRIALDTNVRVKQVRGKNKIEIEFKDEEDLARILKTFKSEMQ